MKNNRKPRAASAIAYVYVGTVVGAGFASGQEIMAFFTAYGPGALIGILVSIVMFIFVGIKLLVIGAKLQAPSFGKVLDMGFGFLAPLVKIYLLFAMLIINGAMLAGAGALFEEVKILPYMGGILVTAVAAVITLAFGIKGLLSINRVIVLGIFTFQIMVFFITLIKNQGIYAYAATLDGNLGLYVKKGISYASMNLFLATGVLAGLGYEFRDIKTLRRAGFIGGIILGTMLITANYCMASQGISIFEHELPMLYVISSLLQRESPLFFYGASLIYSLILWGGIFTTLIGNLFSVVSYLREHFDQKPAIITIGPVLISTMLSLFGFSSIVNNLYPILGLVGAIFIAVIIVSPMGKNKVYSYESTNKNSGAGIDDELKS